MARDRPDPFTRDARACVAAYIAEHPDVTRADVPKPGQGATNRVIFALQGDEIVVCKVFCEAERKARSVFASRHWANTGLVPRLLADIDDFTILRSYIPGVYLLTSLESEGTQVWRATRRATGAAVAALGQVPLSDTDRGDFEARYYGELGILEAHLEEIIRLGRSVAARDPDFAGDFWSTNLDKIEALPPDILDQPRVLYHEDVSNLAVQDGAFQGFFDLEICRVGCAAMQLGTAVRAFLPKPNGWAALHEGHESRVGLRLTGVERRCVAAAAHLLDWREITRYTSYDGTPGAGYARAASANPVTYRRQIAMVTELLCVDAGDAYGC